jgi:hypothetical protein
MGEVTFGNKFIESDAGNGIMVGLLTMAMLISLELAVAKVVFKSKKKNTDMVWRREIFSRLSGFRSLNELLTGLDFTEIYLFDKKVEEEKKGLVNRVLRLFSSAFKKGDEPDTEDDQAEADGAGSNDTTACMLAPRKVHPRRLILPLVCRILLFFAEISVIALSGQRLVADGNGKQHVYLLVPSNRSTRVVLTRGCTSELPQVRGEQATGFLQTCTSSVPSAVYSSLRGSAEIEASRNYLDNSLSFYITTNGINDTDNRYLTVTSTYQSHDGLAQTLLPFDDVPGGSSGVGKMIQGVAKLRLSVLDLIYDRLVERLGVPKANQTAKFSETDTSATGEGNQRHMASFVWEGNKAMILDSLNDTILQDFKLEAQPGMPLISFDEKLSLYGPELGEGAKLLQYNIVPNWVWVFFIFVLGAVAAVFDRINTQDPDFYLFRAFVEVNSMDCVAGPLALENKEFRFAKFESDVAKNEVGHIGFHPADPTQHEVTKFEGVRDIQGAGTGKAPTLSS